MDYPAHFMSVAKPLYALGDLVAFLGEVEEGNQYGLAYITGLEYKPPHTYVNNWWYAVRIICPVGTAAYDNLPEHEIIGRVIHGT
jgi:hypothetical protein